MIEYQTEQDAIAEMHRMSLYLLNAIVIFGFVLYIFN